MDLSIAAGERVLVLGASGAGKSTLLAGLAGLLDPGTGGEQRGSLTVDGLDVRATRRRSPAGLVLQDPQSQLVMARAGDDVAFGLENRGVDRADIWPIVDESLALVGFPYARDRPTAALSGGEAQRLALAGIVALRPGLLLLDEPTANLDPAGADLTRAAVADVLAATGATLVVVEHRVAPWLPLVDRVVVLEPGGGVRADGPAATVLAAVGEQLAAEGVWVPDVPPAFPSRRTRPVGPPLLRGSALGYRWNRTGTIGTDALAAVSVELSAGDALAVTGPNGSGKTTLALTLAGLIAPTRGEVRALPALDADPRPLRRWRARELAAAVGTVFQQPESQFLATTVRAEIAFGPARAGRSPDQVTRIVDDLLDRLRLTALAKANPFTLSGGEKRRLSVATALAEAPPVLVLDEPTFGQDRLTWQELVALLAELRDAGTSLCVVTHDDQVVDALADRSLDLAPTTR